MYADVWIDGDNGLRCKTTVRFSLSLPLDLVICRLTTVTDC